MGVADMDVCQRYGGSCLPGPLRGVGLGSRANPGDSLPLMFCPRLDGWFRRRPLALGYSPFKSGEDNGFGQEFGQNSG